MKKNLILMLMPFAILAVLFYTGAFYSLIPVADATPTTDAEVEIKVKRASSTSLESGSSKHYSANQSLDTAHEVVSYALSLLGSPYVYAGITPDGFDCSGFITHVYNKSGVDLPHSSAMQADEGILVAKHQARTGDLVIFTGTNPDIRKPGHVGIVMSSPGDTIEFVHSSSNGGVKISKVESTRYDQRFLEVRRVL